MSEWPPKRPQLDPALEQDVQAFGGYEVLNKASTHDAPRLWRFTYVPQRTNWRDVTHEYLPHADPHQHSLTKKVKP